MTIFGKEIGFALTVGSSVEIAKLCPDNDIQRIGEILGEDYVKNIETTVKMVLSMNQAYADIQKMEGKEAEVLTEKDILLLTPRQLNEVTKVVMAAFRNDVKGEIEVESKNVEEGAS